MRLLIASLLITGLYTLAESSTLENEETQIYINKLTLLESPAPLLNDHPEFVQPILYVSMLNTVGVQTDRFADSTGSLQSDVFSS